MENYINNNIDNMLNELGELVSYNSVYSEDVAPFGLKNREVLDRALEIFESKGLKTKNLDYYCGYGEVGEGDEVIGILAHLDVVPCGEGWNSDPFKMTEKDGYVYGRGVTDDKGAVIASLYAIKYLLDTGYKFNKRVRLIVGCNEESGSKCIKHYVEKEGHIDYGFTPDADFPGIYGEKGMVGGLFAGKSDKILDIKGDLGQRLETIVYTKADRIIDSLEKNINYLSVVIGLSPMLGLLGTITGMISSFNALNERTQNPMAVTAGIGEALITTVFGLCIAIMGMCIHAYLTSKIKTETLNINEVADTLVDIFKANEQSK